MRLALLVVEVVFLPQNHGDLNDEMLCTPPIENIRKKSKVSCTARLIQSLLLFHFLSLGPGRSATILITGRFHEISSDSRFSGTNSFLSR